MKKLARMLLVSACVVGIAAIAAYAAEQTILGKSFSVKATPGNPTKSKVRALEKNSNDTLVGDPTAAGSAGGAILQIFVNGGTPSSQRFVLNQGTNGKGKPFWSGDAVKGFKYKDSAGEQSAVQSLGISLKKGTFKIKASISGKNGPVSIVPPDPGTSACVAVQLGVDGTSGYRYSVQFGPESNKITNKDGTLFKVTKPVNEGVCPSGPTTTTSSTTTSSTSTTTTTTTSTSTTTTTTTSTSTTTTTTTTSSTTTSTTLPGCPCEGTSFGGVTWDSTFQADDCFNLGTSFYVAAQFDPSQDEFHQLRILDDGTACDIRLSTFDDSDDMPLTPLQRDACVVSLMTIAAADGESCPPSPY